MYGDTMVRAVAAVRGQSDDMLWMALVVAAAKYNGTTITESTGPPGSCCGPILAMTGRIYAQGWARSFALKGLERWKICWKGAREKRAQEIDRPKFEVFCRYGGLEDCMSSPRPCK
jgi:hypothetical protein